MTSHNSSPLPTQKSSAYAYAFLSNSAFLEFFSTSYPALASILAFHLRFFSIIITHCRHYFSWHNLSLLFSSEREANCSDLSILHIRAFASIILFYHHKLPIAVSSPNGDAGVGGAGSWDFRKRLFRFSWCKRRMSSVLCFGVGDGERYRIGFWDGRFCMGMGSMYVGM